MEWDNSVGDCVIEKNVGIIAYANTSTGFQAIHKQRFTDFIVREVYKNEISSLNSIDYGDLEAKLFEQVQPAPKLNAVKTMDPQVIVTEIDREIQEFLVANKLENSEHAIQIDSGTSNYLLQCIEKSEDCADSYNAFPCSSKLLRTKLHEIIRKYLTSVIDSDTIVVNGISYFRLNAKHKRQKGVYTRNNNNSTTNPSSRSFWPKSVGDYLKFTLLKENVDTMSACNIISKALFLRNTSISYAGTKDKRAITSQNCTIYRKKPSDFKRINNSTYAPFIRVGNFEFVNEPIALGQLDRNHFTISLRAIDVDVSIIKEACISLEKSGFINYFGLQRFGKGGSSSNEIGVSLLKSDWKQAVEKLFAERVGDREEIVVGKKCFKEKDYQSAKMYLPNQMISERAVLEHLSQFPIDFAGALNKINRNTRLLCVHAYQSYLFNLAASYRFKLFGSQVVEGDLVVLNPTELELDAVSLEVVDDELIQENIEESTAPTSEVISLSSSEVIPIVKVDDGIDPTAIPSSSVITDTTNPGVPLRKHIIDVHIVTKEDIDNNRFSMDDIVLPLIGCDTKFPTNIGSFFQDLLAHENLTLESFTNCDFLFRSRGSYRRVMERPKNFKWSIKHYSDINEDLMETEVTKFKSKGKYAFNKTTSTDDNNSNDDRDKTNNTTTSVDEKVHKALILEFELHPGTYATMLLRELSKHSTETVYQAHLTANIRQNELDRNSLLLTENNSTSDIVGSHLEDNNEAVNKKAKHE